jgi:hypothetical protein
MVYEVYNSQELESIFPLQFNLTDFIEDFLSANLQLHNRPGDQ